MVTRAAAPVREAANMERETIKNAVVIFGMIGIAGGSPARSDELSDLKKLLRGTTYSDLDYAASFVTPKTGQILFSGTTSSMRGGEVDLALPACRFLNPNAYIVGL